MLTCFNFKNRSVKIGEQDTLSQLKYVSKISYHVEKIDEQKSLK